MAVVTGASGFVGGRLRDALLEDGYDVIALTRPDSPPPKRGRAAAVDYAVPESLQDVLARERPELVFHVAGATKGIRYEDFERGNVMPTRHLLDGLRKVHRGVRRFLHVSSLSVYGPASPERPTEEHHERAPVEFYGKSKLEAELLVEAAGGDVPMTIIRPPTVYGPGDADGLELFKLAARRLNVFYGNRDRYMSFVYVDDLVRGMRDAAMHDATVGKGYFLCDGPPRTWGEHQKEVIESCGKRALDLNLPEACVQIAALFGEMATRIDKKPRLFNRQKAELSKWAWICSDARARADFGYQPRIGVREGMQRTFAWYREQRWI